MTLMKLHGISGTKIYDPRIWSLFDAERDYINTFGTYYESVDRIEFDVITTECLTEWLNSNDDLDDD